MAVSAGILSFLSPCILPLFPSYLSYLSGLSVKEIEQNPRARRYTLFHALFFILGFSLIFIGLGASATLLGKTLSKYQGWIARGGGIILIIFGLWFLGFLKLPFLEGEKRLRVKKKPLGLLGSTIVGMTFGAGWTPCVSPILGTILFYAATRGRVREGVVLLSFYSLGLGIPFFFSAWGFEKFLERYRSFKKRLRLVGIISGFFLIGVGILLLTDYFTFFSLYFGKWFPAVKF